jgi:hypothetical protein
MKVRSLLVVVMCSALSPATSGVAWAQESKADVLFREGREATKRGDHQVACQKFAESYRQDAAAGTLINLGTCEEKLGRVSLAWRHLTDAVKQLPGSDDRVPVAKKMLATLEKRIARLTVVLPPDEEVPRVLLDGLEIPAAERAAPLVVDPGEHVLLATTVDGREARQSVKLAPGEQAETRLSFPPAPSKPTLKPSSPETSNAGVQNTRTVEAGSSGSRTTIGWLLTGVGVAGGVGGAVGAILFYDRKNSADDLCPKGCPSTSTDYATSVSKREDAKGWRTMGIVSAAIGIPSIFVGSYLLFTAPSKVTQQALVVPHFSSNQAGLNLQGMW